MQEKKPSNKQIRSKKRVKEFGEVFTPGFIVNAMNDLCEPDLSDIHKKVLEPACGNGAFLTNILERRLKKCKTNYERLIALTNIYGIDIQPDNCTECKLKLRQIMLENEDIDDNEVYFLEATNIITENNIICGDAINGTDKIYFINYTPANNESFSISRHCMADMLNGDKLKWSKLNKLKGRKNGRRIG